MQLRQYQIDAVCALRESMKKNRHIILQASCGAGKTVISAEIARLANEKGKNVLFLVNRRDLVKQTVEKYKQWGLGDRIGIILSGEESDLEKPIQCASLQTYNRRLKLRELSTNQWFHKADLIIYDECHSSNAPTHRSILECYKDKYILGLSATPMGAGGNGLGNIFDEIITCVPMADLIRDGFLVPALHYAPSKPDLSGIGIVANDYNKKQLGERVDKPKLIGDIFENWMRLASDRKTIIFAVNVAHSKHIKQKFSNYGIKIDHIDAYTKDEEREKIYNEFENGDLQVITNVGVACEGSDLPIASCIAVAKPTRLITRWLQMAGRGARPYPGKTDYILLDFSGCIEQHGLVDEPIDWSLDVTKPAAKKAKKRKKEQKINVCEYCSSAFTGRRCPMCGNEFKDYGKKVDCAPADLVKVDNKMKKFTYEEKKRWWAQFEYERRRLGKTESWLRAQYKSKFGVWYRGMDDVKPMPPSLEVTNFLRYQRIKYAKSMKKKEMQNNES